MDIQHVRSQTYWLTPIVDYCAQFMIFLISGTHFEQELKSQAAKIFGAIDVLGNPMGLINDVTTGISGLVTEGNVGSLLKNVTHGATNSFAKVRFGVFFNICHLFGRYCTWRMSFSSIYEWIKTINEVRALKFSGIYPRNLLSFFQSNTSTYSCIR